MICILFKSLLLGMIPTALPHWTKIYFSSMPFPYRNKYMEINCESVAAVPIMNVPVKKVSCQGMPLSREMIGSPLIRCSMVYTAQVSLSGNLPLLKCPPGHIPMKYGPHGSISGSVAPGYVTYKNLSIFHESVSIMIIWTNLHEIICFLVP